MTPQEFKEKMEEIADILDIEVSHGFADDLMKQVLIELGYEEGVQVFEKMDKWYA